MIAALGTLLATRGAVDGRIRVAVVPFDNETGLDSYTHLAQGIADATVARLAAPGRVDRLAVIGNAAALRRPRSFRDLKQIGEDVNAEYVVLAQVRRDESRVRCRASDHGLQTRRSRMRSWFAPSAVRSAASRKGLRAVRAAP